MPLHAEKLLGHFLSGKAELTVLAYRKDLEDFRLHAKASTVPEALTRLLGGTHPAGQAMVARYRAAMQDRRGLGPATINRRLAVLRSIGKEARILGMVPWALEAKNVRHEFVRDTRGPGRENVAKLLAHMESLPATARALRDTAILRLITDLALRRGTICKLNCNDFAPDAREIKVVSKGKRSREVRKLTAAAAKAIARWLRVRSSVPGVSRSSGAMFVNFDSIHPSKQGLRLSGSAIYAVVKQRSKAAGVRGPIRPHGLRHTSITIAAQEAAKVGLGLDKVREFSGHANTRTLERYLDKTADVQGTLAEMVARRIEGGRSNRRRR